MATNREKLEAVRTAAEIGGRRGGIDLSQWEDEFIDSIEDRLNDGKGLTEKQQIILDKLWDRT